MWEEEEIVSGDYALAERELTDATARLNVTQILQLDFRVDFGPRTPEPVQENMAGLIEGVHDSAGRVWCGSGGCD